jgi:hypothetical protein
MEGVVSGYVFSIGLGLKVSTEGRFRLFEEKSHIFAVQTRKHLQFDRIYPALAGLALGNERLGATHLLGGLNLG